MSSYKLYGSNMYRLICTFKMGIPPHSQTRTRKPRNTKELVQNQLGDRAGLELKSSDVKSSGSDATGFNIPECSGTNWGRIILHVRNKSYNLLPIHHQIGSNILPNAKPLSHFESSSFCCFHLWKASHSEEDRTLSCWEETGGAGGGGSHLFPPWINRNGNVYFKKY